MSEWSFVGPRGPVPCYRANPARPRPSPAVVVLQEIFGLNLYIRSVCDRLAAAGFVAVAPDLFHRNAPGFLATYDEAGFAAGRAQVAALDQAGFEEEQEALLQSLLQDPKVSGKVGVIGFCFGGLLTWQTHCLHPFGAAVVWYGRAHSPALEGIPPLQRTAGMKGPILVHCASHDPMIPGEAVGAMAGALVSASRRGTVEVWPDTHHGFHCDQRSAYEPVAAARSWEDSIRFLRLSLGT